MSKHNKKNEEELKGIAKYYATAEWFIVAISFTLVFIVFQMQAYTIPTGSMADTLKGAHFRLRCSQCAWQFDHSFYPRPYGVAENKTPGKNVPVGVNLSQKNGKMFAEIIPPRCPNCGFFQDIHDPRQYPQLGQTKAQPVMKGDRIFVLKNIYQFTDPKRWDVTVFKNPTQPQINYIKRMIALPGETVEIIDGDIYIDGKIARKPEHVQKELWMIVYNNDFQPARPNSKRFNWHRWSQPFENGLNSQWNLNANGPGVFSLSSKSTEVHFIVYNTEIGNDFRATYAYDDPRQYQFMPTCSDLMVRFYATHSEKGKIGADLSKYGTRYRAKIENSTEMVISAFDDFGVVEELIRKTIAPQKENVKTLFQFANVEHMLKLTYGDNELIYDMGTNPLSAGERKTSIEPRVAIIGSGEIELSHIAIYRDIHYLSDSIGDDVLRAGEGNPLKLQDDEFFVLGDNSPASSDSRYWPTPGTGNNDIEYSIGTVPRDYLVGKAFFVYWPGPYKPSEKFIRIIPNIGGMKTIKGGKL